LALFETEWADLSSDSESEGEVKRPIQKAKAGQELLSAFQSVSQPQPDASSSPPPSPNKTIASKESSNLKHSCAMGAGLIEEVNRLPNAGQVVLNLYYTKKDLTEKEILDYFHPVKIEKIFKRTGSFETWDVVLSTKSDAIEVIRRRPKVTRKRFFR
jgi:hypothetical protein